jgi:hypothetical protein
MGKLIEEVECGAMMVEVQASETRGTTSLRWGGVPTEPGGFDCEDTRTTTTDSTIALKDP